MVNVQTLERCSIKRIDREMGGIVDTVEDRIQNGILTANDYNITPRIELAVRLISASSERDAASITAKLKRGERMGITASFENVSEKNNAFHDLNANEETRGNIPDEENGNLIKELRCLSTLIFFDLVFDCWILTFCYFVGTVLVKMAVWKS